MHFVRVCMRVCESEEVDVAKFMHVTVCIWMRSLVKHIVGLSNRKCVGDQYHDRSN